MKSKSYPIDQDDLQDEDIPAQGQTRDRNKRLIERLLKVSAEAAAKEFGLSATRVYQIWQITFLRQSRRKGRL